MDPLSASASIAGIAEVAVRTTSKIRTLITTWSNAPIELNQLRAVTSIASDYLDNLRSIAARLPAEGGLIVSQNQQINCHLENAQRVLSQLEEAIDYVSSSREPLRSKEDYQKRSTGDVEGDGGLRRDRWLRKKARASLLATNLKAELSMVMEKLVSSNT
jgi:hypothetical protein